MEQDSARQGAQQDLEKKKGGNVRRERYRASWRAKQAPTGAQSSRKGNHGSRIRGRGTTARKEAFVNVPAAAIGSTGTEGAFGSMVSGFSFGGLLKAR